MCVCVLEGFNDRLCEFGCKLDHCLTLTHTNTYTNTHTHTNNNHNNNNNGLQYLAHIFS